ncbi:hypothetical protein C1645_812890 [Glomus cerebriforme]|uniref:Uncharacterized protein n=1 Tax=Glomus cerebriforme TaxID=658196 RepID=A0A397TN33_9GLOM|nr:hypothetical protein C1645_812890 [Glomus cerebriforme]
MLTYTPLSSTIDPVIDSSLLAVNSPSTPSTAPPPSAIPMKFNLFLLFLAIFAINILESSPDDHNLMKRQEGGLSIIKCDDATVKDNNGTISVECTGSGLTPTIFNVPKNIICAVVKVAVEIIHAS